MKLSIPLRSIIASLCIITFYVSGTFSLTDDEKLHADRVLELIYQNDYQAAIIYTEKIMSTENNSAFIPLLKLTALGMQNLDFDTIIDSASFTLTYQNVLQKHSLQLENSPHPVQNISIPGIAKGMYAAHLLRRGAYIPSFKIGIDAIETLKNAKTIDTSDYESSFFIGLYEYAQGELKKRVPFVLFWYPGNKTEGIKRIKESSDNAYLCRMGAHLALADIFIKENMPEQAVLYLNKAKQLYPSSRFVLWSCSKYYEAIKDYATAAHHYKKLSQSYAQSNYGTYNSLFTRSKEAEMLSNTGKNSEAIDIYNEILLACNGKRFRDLHKEIEKKLERLNVGKSR